MSNLGDVAKVLSGIVAQDRGGEDTINQLFDFDVKYEKAAADAMASTTTADTKFWTNPFDFAVRVVGVKASTTGAGLTADNSNYATISVKRDDGAGGATAVAASGATQVTGTGSFTAEIAKNLTLTDANCNVASGAHLYFNIAKTGTGVVVPISMYVVRLRRTG